MTRQLAILFAKVLCKSEEACAESIIYAAIDFSLQNLSGIYIS